MKWVEWATEAGCPCFCQLHASKFDLIVSAGAMRRTTAWFIWLTSCVYSQPTEQVLSCGVSDASTTRTGRPSFNSTIQSFRYGLLVQYSAENQRVRIPGSRTTVRPHQLKAAAELLVEIFRVPSVACPPARLLVNELRVARRLWLSRFTRVRRASLTRRGRAW